MHTVPGRTSGTNRHTLTLLERRTRHSIRFAGECDCGARSAEATTAGMVHGWHAQHRDAATTPRRPPWDAPERLTYEAVILARNPRLALLLDGTLESGVRR